MILKNYKIGFSLTGLIAVLLPMIPNIFWAILPPVTTTLQANDAAIPAIGLLGSSCQFLMIAMLIMMINKERKASQQKKWIGGIAVICLIGYFLSWAVYFTAAITPMLLVGMAVLPSVYFIAVGLYLENYPALIPTAIFAAIHIVTTAQNYL